MTAAELQQAVLRYVEGQAIRTAPRDIIMRVRDSQPKCLAVSDFDFRAAILALLSIWRLRLMPDNRVAVVTDEGKRRGNTAVIVFNHNSRDLLP